METNIIIREITENSNFITNIVGRYYITFYFQNSYQSLITATSTEKQMLGYHLNEKSYKVIDINELNPKIIPHLHVELRRQLTERGLI